MCKYLSLRGSQFINFKAENLLSLQFIDIMKTRIRKLNLRMCTQLRLVFADRNQKVVVNSSVEILPVAAPNGVEGTQFQFGQDVVSFGVDHSSKWGPTTLMDGCVVKFAYNSKHDKIKAINEHNLSQCRCLNLCEMYKLTSIKLEKLQNLCLLIIWHSGIKVIDLTSSVHLELVICGEWCDGCEFGLQKVSIGAGVVKRVMSGGFFTAYKNVK